MGEFIGWLPRNRHTARRGRVFELPVTSAGPHKIPPVGMKPAEYLPNLNDC